MTEEPISADLNLLDGLLLFLTGELQQAITRIVSTLRMDPDNDKAKDLRLRVKAVTELKEEGNKFFKAAEWNNAIGKYTAALKVSKSLLLCLPPSVMFTAGHRRKSGRGKRGPHASQTTLQPGHRVP